MLKLAYKVKLFRWRHWTQIVYGRCFGSVGEDSVIINPTLLLGASAIYLGSRVQIRDGARPETIETRYGRPFTPRVEIGNDTSIEQGFHLTCAERITIGAKVAITQ
jgi:acetyltransferase-like isoleucine patch superfamily enzyme